MVDTPEIKSKLNIDSSEAITNVKNTTKELKNFNKVKKDGEKIPLVSDADIKKLGVLGETISKVFSNFGNLRNRKGQFTNLQKELQDLSQMTRTTQRDLKKIYQQYAGIRNIAADTVAKASVFRSRVQAPNYGEVVQTDIQSQYAKNQEKIERNEKLIHRQTLAQQGLNKEQQDYLEKTEKLNKYLGVTQLRLMANYAAINAVTSSFRYLLNFTVQFDAELKQLQAISAISDTGLQSLKETIYEVAGATKFTSLEIAQAATVLAQAGLSVAQIKETLPAIARLATATGTSLATATDVITSTLNIYSLQVTEATQVTNALTTAMNESKADIEGFQTAIQYAGNFAAQLGVSYEETAAAIAAATQAGIRSKSMLGTGLRAVLTEFLKPTDKLIAQLTKVGLTVNDIDVRSKGLTTVLKTLKNAGFGAAEAFRGMERRGAAFLVAIINQVDFIGSLRQNMAGSTAAMKANEKQMEALQHQFENFQSILGSVVYEGLEPFIKSLSTLMKMLNTGLSKSGGLLSIIFGGIGAGATIAAIAALGKALGNIIVTFTELRKGLIMLKSFSAVTGAIATKGGLGAILAGISVTAIVKWVVMIGMAISAIGLLTRSMGLFVSETDKANSKVEDSLGELDKAQQQYNAVNDVMNRLLKSRSKLDNQAERDIFTREIISRFPEARKFIKNTSLSTEELIELLNKLNNVSLNHVINELKQTAGALKELTQLDISNLLKESIDISSSETSKNLIGLLGKTGVSIEDISKIQGKVSGLRDFSNRTLNPEKYKDYRDAISRVTDEIYNIVKDSVIKSSGDVETAISALKTLATNETDKGLKGIFEDIAKRVEAENNVVKGELSKGFNTIFGPEMQQRQNEWISATDETRKTMEALNEANRSGVNYSQELRDSYIKTSEESTKLAESLGKINKVKTLSDLTKFLGYASDEDTRKKLQAVQSYDSSLKGLSEDQLVEAFVDKYKASIQEGNLSLIDALNNLEAAIREEDKDTLKRDKGIAKDYRDIIRSGIKELSSSSFEERQKLTEGLKKDIETFARLSLVTRGISAKVPEGESLVTLDKTTGKYKLERSYLPPEPTDSSDRLAYANSLLVIENTINSWYKDIVVNSSKATAAIDVAAERLDYFFKELKGNINTAVMEYNQAIALMKEPIIAQKGAITAAERVYGENSLIAEAERNRLDKLEKDPARINEQIQYAENLWKEYQRNLMTLQSNPRYIEAQKRVEETQKAYTEAVKSGNATQIESTKRVADIAARNYEQFTKLEKDWTDKSNELRESIDENTAAVQRENELRNKGFGGQIATGFNAAIENYKTESEKSGVLTLAGSTAKFTEAGIEALDSGFTTMFQNILSGSQRAGDAFKDFGKSVISTLRDIAVQMAVKQGLNLLLSSWGSPSGTSTNLLAQIPGFGGAAQGGLITGPVKNRDSVPTMLMPGEYVMKKSAVDTLGRDYLDNLNSNASTSMEGINSQVQSALTTDTPSEGKASGDGIVNVYVVSQGSQSQMGPKDVLVTISNDILTGGQTKKLIKQVAMGGI